MPASLTMCEFESFAVVRLVSGGAKIMTLQYFIFFACVCVCVCATANDKRQRQGSVIFDAAETNQSIERSAPIPGEWGGVQVA